MNTPLHYLLSGTLTALLLVGCQATTKAPTPTSSPTTVASPVAVISTEVSPTTENEEPASKNLEQEEELGESSVTFATYESCTVYAGATDFYFKTGDGKMLSFRNSNMEGEKPTVKLPIELVDRSGESEGPPGPNPEWVGKQFALALGGDGKVVAVSPLTSGSSSESASQDSIVDSDPDAPVIFARPEGFTSQSFGSHEGTGVFVRGEGEAEVHIFVPNLEEYGRIEILGENGFLVSNNWSSQEVGRQSQPELDWATEVVPFFTNDGMEGAIWVGESNGKAFRVTVSAPEAELDQFYAQVTPMLETMKLREY